MPLPAATGFDEHPTRACPKLSARTRRERSALLRLGERIASLCRTSRALGRTRATRLAAVALAVGSTSVPAGMPDRSEATRDLQRAHQLAVRTALAVEKARVTYIVERYRRPPGEARAIVRAAEQAAWQHGLPASLLLAIAETESSFNPLARSRYGARGLMQVVPRFHPEAVRAVGGSARLNDPAANIEVGARVLAGYVGRAGALEPALARYSGGARNYAAKVIGRHQAIEAAAVVATRNLDGVMPSVAMGQAPRTRG